MKVIPIEISRKNFSSHIIFLTQNFPSKEVKVEGQKCQWLQKRSDVAQGHKQGHVV